MAKRDPYLPVRLSPLALLVLALMVVFSLEALLVVLHALLPGALVVPVLVHLKKVAVLESYLEQTVSNLAVLN